MIRTSLTGLCAAIAIANATPAFAAVEILVSEARLADDAGAVQVDLRLLNGDDQARTVALPDRIEAHVARGGAVATVWLERQPGVAPSATIAAGAFVRAHYQFPARPGLDLDGATLSIPAWGTQSIAISRIAPAAAHYAQRQAPQPASPPGPAPTATPAPYDRTVGNEFLANLSVYEPIYGAYWPGTDSEALIQISFKYQLFGSRQAEGLPASWRDGLHFAFTQQMFWNVKAESSPFRNVDYRPELFYLTPSRTFANGLSLNAQIGARHESNGRAGTASRSLNSLYVAPMASVMLPHGYRLSIAPRLSVLVGDRSDNPDIRRYRGNGGLFVELGEDEGLRLATTSRFNFSSGKGAISADLSYPLPRLIGGGPDVYLFAHGFVGYGENLLDYARRANRFRIGVALVR